jgi:hypothetical protein
MMSSTATIPVDVTRVDESLRADLERVRWLANLMDAQFQIAGVKVGWDAIIGIVPVFGDVVTAAIGVYPLMIARKHKLGRAVQARMALNLLIDWTAGVVPILGDRLDATFRANLKNAELLERAAGKRR